jgi:hypothetical protein
MLVARLATGTSIAAASDELLHPRLPGDDDADIGMRSGRLWAAIEAFDADRLRDVALECAGTWGLVRTLDALVAPAFRRLGDEWRASARNIAREHFASSAIRSLLVGYLPSQTGGRGSCLAFCPEGENHDLGLVMAAVTLAEEGWRPVVLGANTPWASVEALVAQLQPDLVLVGAQLRSPAVRLLGRWSVPSSVQVVLGGSGFRAADAERIGGLVHNGPFAGLAANVSRTIRPSGGRRGPP